MSNMATHWSKTCRSCLQRRCFTTGLGELNFRCLARLLHCLIDQRDPRITMSCSYVSLWLHVNFCMQFFRPQTLVSA